MPFRTDWIEPAVFLEHNGVKVYHTYKNNDIDQPARDNRFSLYPQCGEEECACTTDKCRFVFDVRDLPTWTEPPHPPFLVGKDDTPANRRAWKKYQASSVEEDHRKAAIRAALDQGVLVPPTDDG